MNQILHNFLSIFHISVTNVSLKIYALSPRVQTPVDMQRSILTTFLFKPRPALTPYLLSPVTTSSLIAQFAVLHTVFGTNFPLLSALISFFRCHFVTFILIDLIICHPFIPCSKLTCSSNPLHRVPMHTDFSDFCPDTIRCLVLVISTIFCFGTISNQFRILTLLFKTQNHLRSLH